MPNLFELPSSLPLDEVFETLTQTQHILIERIISTGQVTPEGEWLQQDRDEWVLLLQGEALLTFDDCSCLRLMPGDYLLIPAGQRHRVDFTSSVPACIWLAVHGQLAGMDRGEED